MAGIITSCLPSYSFIIDQPWKEILKASIVPHFEFSFNFLFIITGVFGTTITPYMFFWQASQEVEEENKKVDSRWKTPNRMASYSCNEKR
jgi:Mn2+/Fe2+ NRAMP family transporter